jgi:hypothetical protein
MSERKNLLLAGASIARRNCRYIFWFYLLNVVLAWLGAVAFRMQAGSVMDHSLYSDKVLHGFDVATFVELLARPEFGPVQSSVMPALYFAVLFCVMSVVFMPGVLAGYAADSRLPRDEFFRACGRNLWRFVRVMLFFLLIAAPVFGLLTGARIGLAKAADKASNERLPFYVQITGLVITFLVMTAIRAWFDLAQTEVVVRDQGRVRRSVASGFRAVRGHLGRLVGTYVLIRILAAIVVVLGVWIWAAFVPSASILRAFFVSQLVLFVVLAARFWQRACGVEFFLAVVEKPAEEPAPLPAPVPPAVPIVEGSGI